MEVIEPHVIELVPHDILPELVKEEQERFPQVIELVPQDIVPEEVKEETLAEPKVEFVAVSEVLERLVVVIPVILVKALIAPTSANTFVEYTVPHDTELVPQEMLPDVNEPWVIEFVPQDIVPELVNDETEAEPKELVVEVSVDTFKELAEADPKELVVEVRVETFKDEAVEIPKELVVEFRVETFKELAEEVPKELVVAVRDVTFMELAEADPKELVVDVKDVTFMDPKVTLEFVAISCGVLKVMLPGPFVTITRLVVPEILATVGALDVTPINKSPSLISVHS